MTALNKVALAIDRNPSTEFKITLKSKSLGRGLSALLPDADREPVKGLLEIPVRDIKPNPHQPRRNFDKAELDYLAASIRAKGIVQPLVVRAEGSKYVLIAGERRLRAAKLAELKSVPVMVMEVEGEVDMLEISLMENLQRHDLNPVELAEGYRLLQENWGLTQEAIAQRVGKERATVANTLRLLELPGNILASLRKSEITMGHAKVILSLPGAARQSALWKKIIKERFSVRQTEDAARLSDRSVEQTERISGRNSSPMIVEYTDRLRRVLGTQVKIQNRGKKGFIRIDYYTEEDLVRLVELLEGK